MNFGFELPVGISRVTKPFCDPRVCDSEVRRRGLDGSRRCDNSSSVCRDCLKTVETKVLVGEMKTARSGVAEIFADTLLNHSVLEGVEKAMREVRDGGRVVCYELLDSILKGCEVGIEDVASFMKPECMLNTVVKVVSVKISCRLWHLGSRDEYEPALSRRMGPDRSGLVVLGKDDGEIRGPGDC